MAAIIGRLIVNIDRGGQASDPRLSGHVGSPLWGTDLGANRGRELAPVLCDGAALAITQGDKGLPSPTRLRPSWQERWRDCQGSPGLSHWRLDGSYTQSLTYRINQVITDHGRFGVYLYEIRHASLPMCVHYGGAVDTTVHMLLFCPSWMNQCVALFDVLGLDAPDRTYSVVRSALDSSRFWMALADFCVP
ncbi:PREDICTED: uncharacterized protein LOC108750936 [Trachymyrmex septentrionalis]|uniref:uncharacterized protein LOC108750936 n=1 Tax=Trachymyrmex septentrionalis TaxID=34720 RepID=UPI00084EF289|nr:PREDICTED: uncharacterized protein LOC108750936 [Trachymyrmex septentrionalis]